MSVKSIKNHIDKLNWTVVSVILALLFGIFTVYVYYSDTPNLTFDIVNEANVFDVTKSLDDLNISFQGDDIKKRNLNLRIISIKIENTGNVNILQDFYDKNVIFGLKIDNGQIIESRLIDSNSEYLNSKLHLKNITDTVEFSKIIFDKNKYFIVEILVLHDKNKIPNVTPLGKIAGIDNIEIVKSYTETPSFFDSIVSGSLLVQLSRLIIYPFIFIFMLSAIYIVHFPINKLRTRRKNQKKIKLVKKLDLLHGEFTSKNKTIIEKILICTPYDKWRDILNSLKIYRDNEANLMSMPTVISDEKVIYIHNDGTSELIKPEESIDLNIRYFRLIKTIYHYLYKHNLFDEISNQGHSEPNTQKTFKVNEQFLKDLNSSISFLEND
jgi:hypothetical protein